MDEPEPTTEAPACYRHPDREALLRCSRCERPICADDAIEAPVGYQCPECATGGAHVRRLTDLIPDARVTKTLVGIVAAVFLVTQVVGEQQLFVGLGLVPARVGLGEWWRLITSGFLHAGIVHVAFNGILLWRLGEMLEPTLGHLRFAALYLAGLAGGSLGVVLLAWATIVSPLLDIPVIGRVLATSPVGVTVGASGAVFALMGAAMTGLRSRGIDPWRSDIGTLVLLNLVITFLLPGISVGGHVGGLLTGMLAGKLLFVGRERIRRATILTTALGVAMLVLAIVLATAMVGVLN